MGMCYGGTLVMPSSYAVMSEDEMTYVEGGAIAIPNWLVAGVVNLLIDAIVIGGCRKAASFFAARVKKYGAKATGFFMSEKLRKKLIAKGIACAVASGICNIAAGCITVLTWALDPGGAIAVAIDNRDSKPGSECVEIF